jgi:NTP pyrophosphatase (non-canonical NTP hydrolase)
MEIGQIQFEVMEWAAHNFPNAQVYQPLIGIMEEVGELAHAHLKQEQNIRTNENHTENAKDAIGDIIIYLMDYCNRRNFNLSDIIIDTWSLVKKRDWQKNKIRG